MLLLDTNIISSLFVWGDDVGSKYEQVIQRFITDTKDSFLIAPTPVCFELSKWSRWDSAMFKHSMFIYAHRPITSDIHELAAKYLLCVGEHNTNNPEGKQKISDMDAMIAAYALRGNYKIITCNQGDFPPKFFNCDDVVAVENKGTRNTIFLLSPKPDWQKVIA